MKGDSIVSFTLTISCRQLQWTEMRAESKLITSERDRRNRLTQLNTPASSRLLFSYQSLAGSFLFCFCFFSWLHSLNLIVFNERVSFSPLWPTNRQLHSQRLPWLFRSCWKNGCGQTANVFVPPLFKSWHVTLLFSNWWNCAQQSLAKEKRHFVVLGFKGRAL